MDENSFTMALLFGSIIGLIILYFIIKSAVRAGNSEVERLLRILINLKGDEMIKQGFTNEEVQNIIKRVDK